MPARGGPDRTGSNIASCQCTKARAFMLTRWETIIWVAFALVPGFVALGCDDTEASVDCASVCDRYKDCFDKSFDANECADNCADKADDHDFQNRVDDCDDCIDDESCSEAAFKCTAECVGVVP